MSDLEQNQAEALIQDFESRDWDEYMDMPENRSERPNIQELLRDNPDYLDGFLSTCLNFKIEGYSPKISISSKDRAIPELVNELFGSIGINYEQKNVVEQIFRDNRKGVERVYHTLNIHDQDEVAEILEYLRKRQLPFISDQIEYLSDTFFFREDNGDTKLSIAKREKYVEEFIRRAKIDLKAKKEGVFKETKDEEEPEEPEVIMTPQMLAGMIDANLGSVSLNQKNGGRLLQPVVSIRRGRKDIIQSIENLFAASDLGNWKKDPNVFKRTGVSTWEFLRVVRENCRMRKSIGVIGEEILLLNEIIDQVPLDETRIININSGIVEAFDTHK